MELFSIRGIEDAAAHTFPNHWLGDVRTRRDVFPFPTEGGMSPSGGGGLARNGGFRFFEGDYFVALICEFGVDVLVVVGA